MTGFDGGQLRKMVDIDIHIPSDCIEHVEDIHLMLEHLICKAIKEMAAGGIDDILVERVNPVTYPVP